MSEKWTERLPSATQRPDRRRGRETR